ncbi:MAG: hypothetical protein DRQ40_02135 [Gammaproteobacteria bacterium]|nr:MAG: hypothetical protein DRQ40_02135 [Gammaproteobacteria bacterium]
MAGVGVVSGLVQSAQPQSVGSTFQALPTGAERVRGANEVRANLDPNSPIALPEIPTTEVAYDGLTAFGIFITDPGLDGDGPQIPE